MNIDFFQSVRRDGAAALSVFERLTDVNIVNDDGQNLLHEAVAHGNDEAGIDLIRLGIDVNAQDSQGQTPLHYACAHRNTRLAQAILGNGGRVDVTDHHGNSPLWVAAFNASGDYEIVKMIATPELAGRKNGHGRSPLDLAKEIGDEVLIGLLLK